ncbi:MAG: Gfo/Idh/MocA family oxidoreductase [Chloroflexota bacterium]|nr:Gfo/Idh/MocA family oxidoreductase [Chloroflexota bacterium]
MNGDITVAVVGMHFGAEFVPIFLHHPDVARVVICDSDMQALAAAGERFGVEDRRVSLEAVLADETIDAVHLVTAIPDHAAHSIATLEAGKHCACAVPMATSLADIKSVIAAQRESGRVYMMMETAVRTREFLWIREQLEASALGRIQFLRGAHYQDMENWPDYWLGLPPMHYATHAIAPLLALAGTRAKRVHCFGSGQMRAELRERYGNPYPIETAIFQLEGTDIAAEVTRSLFHTARAYSESFNVYGERATFEWQQIEDEAPVLFRMAGQNRSRVTEVSAERVEIPDRADLLPPEIARFTRQTVYDEANPDRSFLQGGGHSGSHPHLVHEFVRAIVEERPPTLDAVAAADWAAAGICAHESAMQGGKAVEIPSVR